MICTTIVLSFNSNSYMTPQSTSTGQAGIDTWILWKWEKFEKFYPSVLPGVTKNRLQCLRIKRCVWHSKFRIKTFIPSKPTKNLSKQNDSTVVVVIHNALLILILRASNILCFRRGVLLLLLITPGQNRSKPNFPRFQGNLFQEPLISNFTKNCI